MIYRLLSPLFLGVVLPWAFWHGWRRGTPVCFVWRRCSLPESLQPCDVWLHGVSAGEVRALEPLIRRIQLEYPAAKIAFSSATPTGVAEAKKLLPEGQIFSLPFDFPWVMQRLVNQLKPQWLILSEGDLWWGMLSAARTHGVRVAVVGAKVSDRSFVRWRKILPLARRLFRQVHLFCAQSMEMARRLEKLTGSSTCVVTTGSLKEDRPLERLTAIERDEWVKRLQLNPERPTLLCGSTHAGEEAVLIEALHPLIMKGWQLIFCPRHPQRAKEVQEAGLKRGLVIPIVSEEEQVVPEEEQAPQTEISNTPEGTYVRCVGQFGVLTRLMQLSDVVILGGSFLPGTGGHNILEPIQLGKPVLWGPYMENQRALETQVIRAKAGQRVELPELSIAVQQWAKNRVEVSFAGQSTERTWIELTTQLGFLRSTDPICIFK